MEDLISVIVPVYNVINEIDYCVDSLINQTYQCLEIILVDDGSTDGSSEKLDEYEKCDSRITVYHKENGGLSDARNYGIDRANGEYIFFLDSDDYLYLDSIEILYGNIIKYSADISFATMTRGSELSRNKEMKRDEHREIVCCSGIQYLQDYYVGIDTVVACNKLCHISLFNDIRFPYGKYHEDEFVTYKLLYNSRLCVYDKIETYYYYQRDNSIMNSINGLTQKSFDGLDALEEKVIFYMQERCYVLEKLAVERLFVHFKVLALKYAKNTDRNTRIRFVKKNQIYVKRYLWKSHMSLYEKIKWYSYYLYFSFVLRTKFY